MNVIKLKYLCISLNTNDYNIIIIIDTVYFIMNATVEFCF